jgi:chromosome segregation protein
MEQLRQSLVDANRVLDSKRNEHDLLKSLIDSMEGYPESVKFLHNNTEWNHTSPVLSDIIYVKEAFRAAVENVLEPYLNYYVVNNLKEGLQAVHLLDRNRKGKANFFLLDQLGLREERAIQPANTIPAMDVIEVDEKYRMLAQYLLGNVFIAENEEALESASSTAVVLEKTGKYVKGRFTLSGGSVGLFEGKKIGRAKNLEKLAEDIQNQESVVNLLKLEIQHKQEEIVDFKDQLKDQAIRFTQEDISRLTNLVFALQNKAENLHAAQGVSEHRLQESQIVLEETIASVDGTRQEWMQWVSLLNDLRERLQVAEADYKSIEGEYNKAQEGYNEFNLMVARQNAKIIGLSQELEFKQNQLYDLKSQMEVNSAQLKQTNEQISESEEALRNAEEGLVTLMRKKEEDEKVLNEADQSYYNIRNKLSEKESELRHKVKEKEFIDQILSAIKDELSELRLQLAGMKERMHVEFRINLDDILDQPRTGETSVEELQEKCDRMKKRLENLGEVNPTAIEAFQEMKKRYEFILEQKNDLVSAKDSLLQTIQEVEATANQQFLDTFNKVRENFQKVFKALFTEDDMADMILENPENLADTGIDIIAKPKGKRPSSITQLSGGEKTLTATALLFAIYLIKPAPFCILDEVDAPLDDANVGKFTNMIRKFSEESQFIIVTHNKMTMNAVDVIYGVTMQEPGVSKLVPVDFRSLN